MIATLGTEPQVVTLALLELERRGDAGDEVVVIHTTGQRDERIVAAVADLDRAFVEEPRLARYRYQRVLLEGDGGPLEDIAIEADVMGGIFGIIGLEQTWRWIMPRQMLEVWLEAVPLLFLAGADPTWRAGAATRSFGCIAFWVAGAD